MLLDAAGCLKPLHLMQQIIIYDDEKGHMSESVSAVWLPLCLTKTPS